MGENIFFRNHKFSNKDIKNVPTNYKIELFAVFVVVLIFNILILVSILFALVVNWQKQGFFLFRERCISPIKIVLPRYHVYFQAASADIKYIFVIIISVLVLNILCAFIFENMINIPCILHYE